MRFNKLNPCKFFHLLGIAGLLLFMFPSEAKQVNLARYRVVNHSSSSDVNHCGHLVVDGSLNTYWESYISRKHIGPFSEWLIIDLASPQKVDQIEIHWGSNYATAFKISLLQNINVAGTEVFSTTQGTGSSQPIDGNGMEARYLRLDISDVKDHVRGCIINEIEVRGEGSDRFIPSEVRTLSADNLSLNGEMWRVQNAMFVSDKPESISKSGYNDLEWIPAKVPGTILGDYYNFGALPDPLYGDNMHQISDEFFSGNNFWYRSELWFPSELSEERVFLDFSGINWKSEIYFNGIYLGRIDGAFQRGEFEITDFINLSETNTLAVLVHHNENWVSGSFKIIRKTLGERTSNGDMLGLDGPTSLASGGWNWLPIIKGRNNGIWNNVSLRTGGNVSIKDPWVDSKLPIPDTSQAYLTIRTELNNHSSEDLNGKLLARFGETEIELPVKLEANEVKTITLDYTNFPELNLKDPKLWWPNGYGQQNLMPLKLQFVDNGKVSDSKKINFGIRQLEYKELDGVLYIYCNGYRILLRGGNWGLPEAMMRLDSAAYDLRVKLHRDANLNMIRNWVGMTNREEFYDACDRYGILIFDDFWLANPKNGPNPKDFDMFMANVRDKILWARKHPSLAFYCGRNEGLPVLEYDTAMRNETERLDGTRHYVPNSAAGSLSGFGPYEVKSPQWYFEKGWNNFHSELGIIAIPEVESIRKMMPEKHLWPIDDMWALHDYQYNRSFKYTSSINKRFGEASSVEEYSNKAQLQNYETGKAMMESFQSEQGSGLILWMSQSAWPSMICQLYDHYLEYTASYFAIKKASSPIHAFWDRAKNDIRIVNNTKSDLRDANIQATIYDAEGSIIWRESVTTDVKSATVKSCFPLQHKPAEKVLFMKLELKADKGQISENFYWMENAEGNCMDLNDLYEAHISISLVEGSEDGYYTAQVELNNESSVVSLLNKIKVKDKLTGESILPVFFDDDYVSLLPGESKMIRMKIEEKFLQNKTAEIHLEGWNTTVNRKTINSNK